MSSDNTNLPPEDDDRENNSGETPDPRPVHNPGDGPLNPLVPQVGTDGHLYLPDGTRLLQMPIEDEMKGSYLTYAMSVIISRALP
ncbi:MAG: hypothetical protein J6S42_07550, partial [Thermoguttaceae bacterium]|nr:hypothetical protein [Thermoguttaceae bacterium]